MIGRIVRGIVMLVVVIGVAIGVLFVGARFQDGQNALIPGGPLQRGELVTQVPSDWGFAAGVQEIEMQLAYEHTSRTTWIVTKDDAAFIPCSLDFPPGKRWYKAADQNGAAILRIAGKRYPVTLSRVKDDAAIRGIGQATVAKYPAAAGFAGEGVWFFKVEPRASSG